MAMPKRFWRIRTKIPSVRSRLDENSSLTGVVGLRTIVGVLQSCVPSLLRGVARNFDWEGPEITNDSRP